MNISERDCFEGFKMLVVKYKRMLGNFEMIKKNIE